MNVSIHDSTGLPDVLCWATISTDNYGNGGTTFFVAYSTLPSRKNSKVVPPSFTHTSSLPLTAYDSGAERWEPPTDGLQRQRTIRQDARRCALLAV
jgi:hypothetical protein